MNPLILPPEIVNLIPWFYTVVQVIVCKHLVIDVVLHEQKRIRLYAPVLALIANFFWIYWSVLYEVWAFAVLAAFYAGVSAKLIQRSLEQSTAADHARSAR